MEINTKLISPAKINLRLKITGRRADGYHFLDMINAPLQLSDTIEIKILEEPEFKLKVQGEYITPEIQDPMSNLATRAAFLFFEKFKLKAGIELVLHKRIPIGSGLAGGSSNAAFVLKELFRVFSGEIGLEENDIKIAFNSLAAKLGSDVHFFFEPVVARVRGVGEIIEPIKIPQLKRECLLCIPSIQSSTAAVYQEYRLRGMNFSEIDTSLDYSNLNVLCQNDLEESACHLYHEIAETLELARKVTGTICSMTGSGSAIFMLPEEGQEFSSDCKKTIENTFSDWAGKLIYTQLLS